MARVFQSARSFMKSSSRALPYDAAGDGPRSRDWGTDHGPNTALLGSLEKLRKRARHEVRTNTWAASGVEVIVSNVVGSGINPMHKNPALLALWREWSTECDAYHYTDFPGLQTLAMRAVVEGGEAFVRIRPRRMSDGLKVPFQLQVLEPEMVPSTLNKKLPNGNRIVAGIEHNLVGKPVAYHMLKSHPGEGSLLGDHNMETVRVPAEGVLHLRLMRRPGEVRGEPWLTKALVRLKELSEYDDAELVRKRTAALYAGFIHTAGAEDDDDVVAGLNPELSSDAEDVVIDPLEPGSMITLPPGYDVKFSQPVDVGGTYEAFMRSQLRSIASALGITYEQLTGDLGGVNDRLIRASLLEFKRRARSWQSDMMIHQLCRPVWRSFIEFARLAGEISDSTDGVDIPPSWIPESWEHLHPAQDISALEAEVRAGFKARSEVIRQRGRDPEAVDELIAQDNARAERLGLMHSSDGRYDKMPDLPQDDDQDDDPQEDTDNADTD